MNGQGSLIEMVTESISSKREDDWWDFKEFHYEDKGSMLHDIICLANCVYCKNARFQETLRENKRKSEVRLNLRFWSKSLNF